MKPILYVGTHRRAHRSDPQDLAFGIYAYDWELDGKAAAAGWLTQAENPGWITAHPSGRYLYAVNEVAAFEGRAGGAVSAFKVGPHPGELTLLNRQPTDSMPCHCEVDRSGRYLLVATHAGGSVHLFPVTADGRLGPSADVHHHTGSSLHPRRQASAHAHAVSIDHANRFVLVPDLGIDQIRVYELDAMAGKLRPQPARTVALPPGSGPRHIAFDGHARFVYLINELGATLTVFAYEAHCGALHEIQTVDLLPDGFAGLRSGAGVLVHPSGRFLYATTRSHGSSGEPPVRGLDCIVWFNIDAMNGTLRQRGRLASGGELPRSFIFDASGEHLIVGHQASASVNTFRLDMATGEPIATGRTVQTPVPVCLHLVTAP